MADTYKGHAKDCELFRKGGALQCSCAKDVGALVAKLRRSCRYAGTDNAHGSPISACPGACREHAVMTDAADALLAQQAEVARLTQENERLAAFVAQNHIRYEYEGWMEARRDEQ